MTNPQTKARAIAWEVRGAQLHRVFLDEAEARELASRFKGVVTPLVPAAALAAKDAELAETVSALWRIPPNMHTIPCEANGFAEPDPFEGVGETYADAYTREKSRAERAEAALRGDAS